MRSDKMRLSVIIPAHNEEILIKKVVLDILEELNKESILNEIIIVDDNSSDSTPQIADQLAREHDSIRVIHRSPPNGFGRAIKEGIDNVKGDIIVTAMGDASDDPKDIVRYFRKIEEGYDCVFGSRFVKGAVINDYPLHKFIVNRLANTFLQVLFLPDIMT